MFFASGCFSTDPQSHPKNICGGHFVAKCPPHAFSAAVLWSAISDGMAGECRLRTAASSALSAAVCLGPEAQPERVRHRARIRAHSTETLRKAFLSFSSLPLKRLGLCMKFRQEMCCEIQSTYSSRFRMPSLYWPPSFMVIKIPNGNRAASCTSSQTRCRSSRSPS